VFKRFLIGAALLLAASPFCFAQGFRIGDELPVSTSLNLPGVISTQQATIAVCAHPANATPCTNKATTYTDITLGTSCLTSAQVVLAGTSSCVATTDSRGNWGAWVASGTYDVTITVPTGQSYGPFPVSAGSGFAMVVPSGGNVQTAMNTACAAGGGTVFIQNGTYTGPTTFCSGVILQATQPNRPDLCIESLGSGCPSPTSPTPNVTLTYANGLTISDVSGIGIVGITLDFTNSTAGNVTMAGVAQSNFDMTINHCILTSPCLILGGTSAHNGSKNTFPYLGVAGGSEGIKWQAGGGHGWFVNTYGQVVVAELNAPSGTYTAIDFNSQCDTNNFQQIIFYSNQTAANGVIFNSASTTVDNDANSIVIQQFASTAPNFTSGTGITFNPSSGNYIQTGVMNWTNLTPCGTASLYCVATGGPANSPNYTWIQSSATATSVASISNPQFNAQCGSSGCVPTYNWSIQDTLLWQVFLGASNLWTLHDAVNNLNPVSVQQGTPNNTLTINNDGTISPGTTTFSGLGSSSNGHIVYCSNCTIANPCASGGTGALAKRLNGVWVCN
jgi:hypothetical protein